MDFYVQSSDSGDTGMDSQTHYEQYASSPTQGMPIHPVSQDASLPRNPVMYWDDGSAIPVTVIDEKILWEGMFILPNRVRWIALLIEGPTS